MHAMLIFTKPMLQAQMGVEMMPSLALCSMEETGRRGGRPEERTWVSAEIMMPYMEQRMSCGG